MRIYLDEKLTIWRRTYYDANTEDLNKAIQQGNVEEYIDSLETQESELLYETEEPMSVKENGNQPTIEVFNNEFINIYNNK